MRTVLCLVLAAATLSAAGCASFCGVVPTPEDIARNVSAGNSVRIRTRANRKLRLRVTSVEGRQIKGRPKHAPSHAVWVAFGAIERLEVECPESR